MRQFRKLLLACVIAAAAAPAQSGDDGLGSIPYSFSDVLEFTLGTQLAADAAKPATADERTFAALVRAGANFTLAQFAPPAAGNRRAAPVATMPKPEEWMTLLSGLVAMLFIARRKLSLLAR